MSALRSTALSLKVSVRREDVLGFLGYPAGQPPPARIERLLDAILEHARSLVHARGAFAELEVSEARSVGLEPIAAERLVIGLVTAGEEIERSARSLLDQGRLTEAVLLDAAGSAAAEEAANRLGARIVQEHESNGGEASLTAPDVPCRLSPGYGRWALESQSLLFRLLPHRELGVKLLPSLLMVPRKSISFAMWLGATVRPAAGLAGCASCALERCRYRRRAVSEATS